MDFELATDPPVTYAPVGRCIYCSSSDSHALGDEHIIPYSLNGTQILPRASCRKCEAITSHLDGFIARSVFYQVRASAGIRSRRTLPGHFSVILTFEDGHTERVKAPANVHPSILVLPHFTLPNLLSGIPSDGNFRFTYQMWMRESTHFDDFIKARGAKSAEVEATVKPQQFSRVLAKIAHSLCRCQIDVGGVCPPPS